MTDDEIPDHVRCRPMVKRLREIEDELSALGLVPSAAYVQQAANAIAFQAEQIDGLRRMIDRARKYGLTDLVLIGDDAEFFKKWREKP